jgi:hypothetical protein
MTRPIIKQPQNKSFNIPGGGKVNLTFNTNFQPKWQGRFDNAQYYLDSEALDACDPYIPFQTGMLRDSGIENTIPGSGVLKWATPYARRRYYEPIKHGSGAHPQGGPYWFTRMWVVEGKRIMEVVNQIVGGKVVLPKAFGKVIKPRKSVFRILGFGRKKKKSE